MSLADPAVLDFNGTPKSLIRVRQDNYSSEYVKVETNQEFRLNVRNTSYQDKKRGGRVVNRHNIELIQTIYPIAPALTNTVRKVYVVLENDQGDTLADPVITGTALLNFLSGSSGANLTKTLNYES
ncbi:TPA_asm: coat protein [ssRNA phage Gerhypos.4_14]|uniref:Coat protein n=2 Tax=Leviviricetes TaxID=2842243 RepID=A0A8S5L395_9VIRU|nr:coat protein [ssRNA phage Gerhypos.4_14]QDH87946.1 MAG: hypothetical protein H4Bulk46404_000002 [Leviviridae sp.]DAD51979.1 TPA_asm: coat protein [ssRNA phage Gerhypos.4_14]